MTMLNNITHHSSSVIATASSRPGPHAPFDGRDSGGGDWPGGLPPGATGSKTYGAFISYAESDRALAMLLKELLHEAKVEAFVARENLADEGVSKWRKAIFHAIRSSHCFVPVLTRRSLERSWPIYELGIADACDATVLGGRVRGLSSQEIALRCPTVDMFVYDLGDEASILKLVFNICRAANGAEIDPKLAVALSRSDRLRAIADAARQRWIFLGGNAPHDDYTLDRVEVEGRPGLAGPAKLELIAADITRALLQQRYSVASCPEVEHVGRIAAEVAIGFVATRDVELTEHYRIGGRYPIDREKRRAARSDKERTLWKQLFEQLRKSDLRDCDWLIVLGGNEGTLEEVQAARKVGTKVLTLAPLGGAGQVIRGCEGVTSLFGDQLVWNADSLARVMQVLENGPGAPS